MAPTPDVAGAGEGVQLDDLFECLASSKRRYILGLLHERAPSSFTYRDLATYLVPGYQENPQDGETGRQIKQALVNLRHTHLPRLESTGLINQATETVSRSDHPAFQDPGILAIIGNEPTVDSASLDALCGALADQRRRTILDVLSHQFGPIRVQTLARDLVARELDLSESEVDVAEVEERLVSLRHVHLPRLSEAELIDYDVDEQMVEYRGHPELRVPWMHSDLEPDFRRSLADGSAPDGMGTITGREQIVSFGQSLCDRVDEELFCMFTDTHLLEAGCLTRLRDASRERDVAVYLGTCDPVIREYVQQHAPEVILWEPSTNWMNLPVAGSRVGRLLLADREAVMLGTLNENTGGDIPEEQAIIGEGPDNALVVMITQILGPYLEVIGSQTEAIEAQLPF